MSQWGISTHCVLWPDGHVWLRLLLASSETSVLSALPVCNEQLDDGRRRWRRWSTRGQLEVHKWTNTLPPQSAEERLDFVKAAYFCKPEGKQAVLMFTVAAVCASSGLFFSAGKAYYRKWRSDSLFKDSIFSFAAELCCETSFYHPSPRSILLPSLSASAPRLRVLWKAPFVRIWVQFIHVLMTAKSRYHLGTLPFDLSANKSAITTLLRSFLSIKQTL